MKRPLLAGLFLGLVFAADAGAFGRRVFSCGCGYSSYYAPTYYQAPAAPAYTPPAISYTDPDWRTKIVELLQTQAKYEGQIRVSANEHNVFMETVKALGLYGVQGYGGKVPLPQGYGGYGQSLQYGNFGVQGDTIYGYSVNTRADYYGQLDPMALIQASSRALDRGQDYLAAAHSGTLDVFKSGLEGQARAAEIRAFGQAFKEAMQKTSVRTKETYIGNAPQVVMPPANGVMSMDAFMAMARQDCGACHTGPKGEKNRTAFNLEDYPKFSLEQKAIVHGRLLTHDAKLRMPRLADGGGGQLPIDKIREWLSH